MKKYCMNPITYRDIEVNGPTFNKLIREKNFKYYEKENTLFLFYTIHPITKEEVPLTMKLCDEMREINYHLNPYTKQFFKKINYVEEVDDLDDFDYDEDGHAIFNF